MNKYTTKFVSKLFVLVAVLFFGITFFVVAGEKMPESAQFSEIDTNGDGFISKAEAINRNDLAKNWNLIDKDKNNKVNIDEFIAYESQGRFSPPEDAEVAELGAAPME
jgi:preprotein translocase subunit SecG